MSTFCPLPWNSINLRNNGDLRICCNTNSYSPNRGIMKDEDGFPYNAGRDDLNEARNADIIKSVRASMMKGEWHPECERCRQEEINNIKSRRQWECEQWELSLEQAKQMTKEDGTIDPEDFDIEFFDIRYGNFCNLKCRMCGPTDSHTWYSDFVDVYEKTEYRDTHDVIKLVKNDKGRWDTDQYDWFKNSEKYWENFTKYTSKAKKLYIVGGEPLIIEEHVDTLQKLIDNGSAHKMEIEYNTNLTNVTPRMFDLWRHFKQIRMGVSIDGYGDVLEYQRAPAKWKSIYKNLKKINDNNDVNFKCWYAFTVTALNVFHLPEFMKWKLTESNLEKFNPLTGPRPIITHHMCHAPKHLNVKVLTPELKDDVVMLYEQYYDWIMKTDFHAKVKMEFVNILDGVVDFMTAEDYSKEHLDTFIKHTTRLDLLRNQNILDVAPQYEQLFKSI